MVHRIDWKINWLENRLEQKRNSEHLISCSNLKEQSSFDMKNRLRTMCWPMGWSINPSVAYQQKLNLEAQHILNCDCTGHDCKSQDLSLPVSNMPSLRKASSKVLRAKGAGFGIHSMYLTKWIVWTYKDCVWCCKQRCHDLVFRVHWLQTIH